MMDQMIIVTLALISTLSIVNGQLYCFVCTNCPDLDELDETMSHQCSSIPPPSTTDLPTTTPDTTTDTTPDTTTDTTPDTTTEPTPDTTTEPSTPVTPPTGTLPPGFPENHNNTLILTYESPGPRHANKNRPINLPRGSRELLLQQLGRLSPSNGIYRCFRISRNVEGTTEVVRGCVIATNSKQDTCNRANDDGLGGVAPLSCRICNYDNCNVATQNTTTSIILILTTIVSINFLN
ncbi:hypothetical protein Bhyg_02267 [Pseudolycoriella hygida]|uniref:Uncharacterized protein n=1 Tax=Pseudolycoriella hygida TaxID=35572 RepID=A0A9Q0S6H9_9DIPT|nr:hypothetical protein Bhyg_02267 [Pseudolycoriella hygida]